jgi:hypothetical protein
MQPIEPVLRPRALLLDMDGTITEPMLDLPRIKLSGHHIVLPVADHPSVGAAEVPTVWVSHDRPGTFDARPLADGAGPAGAGPFAAIMR